MEPDGFNVGLDLGKIAGAGIAEHLHLRATFMPVLAGTRVVPQRWRIPVASWSLRSGRSRRGESHVRDCGESRMRPAVRTR
jgi:hypothetical protein